MTLKDRLKRLEQRRPHQGLSPEHDAAVRKAGFDSLRFEYGYHLSEEELWACALRDDPKLRAMVEGRKWWD